MLFLYLLTSLLETGLDCLGYLDGIEWLDYKAACTRLQCLLNVIQRRQIADHDHADTRGGLPDLFSCAMTIHAGHVDIDEGDIGLVRFAKFDGLFAVMGFRYNLMAMLAQQQSQYAARRAVVVGNDNVEFSWRQSHVFLTQAWLAVFD